jgi:hypothetical protein
MSDTMAAAGTAARAFFAAFGSTWILSLSGSIHPKKFTSNSEDTPPARLPVVAEHTNDVRVGLGAASRALADAFPYWSR